MKGSEYAPLLPLGVKVRLFWPPRRYESRFDNATEIIEVTGTVMSPTKAGVKKFNAYKVVPTAAEFAYTTRFQIYSFSWETKKDIWDTCANIVRSWPYIWYFVRHGY